MALFVYCFIAFLLTNRANSATHWIVTEDGRIQSQMDSLFNLQRPYDLVAMLKQEDRARVLEDLKQELLLKKENIDKSEDRDTGLEQRFYRMDPDCIAAGKPLPEFDLYISTVLPLENKGIRPEEHIDFKAHPVPDPVSPSCTDMTDLDFSMEAFEHLEGVRDRANLTGTAELGLKNAITHRENVDDYGHLVYEALRKNKTSWELYNMAAFYWRIKGHPYNVVECIRRALHYSPRSHKDVALISLANVLHRARYSNEAAIVVQAALDISRELNVNHFTLGNIYAVLAEYNKSVICFENTLKIQPDFEAAEKRKHAVLCHAKLEAALEDQHRSLQRTLNDLKEYQQKHEAWQTLQERIQQDQASTDIKFAQRVGYESYKIRKMASGVGEYCRFEDKDGRQVLQCSWARSGLMKSEDDNIRSTWSYLDEKAVPMPEPSHTPQQRTVIPAQLVYMEPVHTPKYTTKRSVTPEEEAELEFKKPDWPTKEECDTYVTKFPGLNEYPTTYLPPENKGFEVKLLLSEAQDLKEGMQHALPWYPPVCNLVNLPEGSPKSYDHIQSIVDRAKLVQKIIDPSMKDVLLSLVDGDVTEAEIGQRILTAVKHEIGPQWMLYNLAALYWRVMGNSQQGIECLRHSLYFVPKHYKDVPLVNLANLLYKLGRVDDAVTVMKDAVALNDMEPETHYFLGNVLAAKGNITGATYHYEQALLQDPDHVQAFSSIRTLQCYYKYHRTAQSAAPPPKDAISVTSQSSSCSQACTSTCRNNKQGGATMAGIKSPVDSRLVCKKEAGRENCVLETTTPNCDHGQCSQSCHVSPLAMETCEGPNGLKCLGHNTNLQAVIIPSPAFRLCVKDLPADGSMPKCPVEVKDPKNCRQPTSLDPLTDTVGPNPMADPGFHDKMEAVKEYYKTRGLCTGDECQKFFVQCITSTKSEANVESYIAQHFAYHHPLKPPPLGAQCSQPQQHRPHTKLELQDGVLHQKLILVDNPEDIVVGPSDCIIYNDGRKTPGCQREEYRAFVEPPSTDDFDALLAEYLNLLEAWTELSILVNEKLPDQFDNAIKDFEEFSTLLSTDESSSSHGNKHTNEPTSEPEYHNINKPNRDFNNQNEGSFDNYEDEDEDLILHEEDEESELEGFDWEDDYEEEGEDVTVTTDTSHEDQKVTSDLKKTAKAAKNKLDPMRHITMVTDLLWPTWEECRNDYKIADFKDAGLQQFSSTWVSVSTKNVDVRSLLSFQENIKGLQEPFCSISGIKSRGSSLDEIDSLSDVSQLSYTPERGLLEMLQTLGGDNESVGVVGTRIGKALKAKPKSWAVANLAALYWRVEGDAEQAIKCLHVGYHLAPDPAKDIALLGIANILYNAGSLDDALTACDLALQADNKLVATHFTMANIYNAKEEYGRARSFYESTLGLQSSFHPARDRLMFLRCHKVLSNPHLFKETNPNTLKMEL